MTKEQEKKVTAAYDNIVNLSGKMSGLSLGEARIFDDCLKVIKDFILEEIPKDFIPKIDANNKRKFKQEDCGAI